MIITAGKPLSLAFLWYITNNFPTSDSKVMIRAVNKLKMRSKTDEVASVRLKVNKACLYSFADRPIRFLVKIRSKNHLR